MIALMMRSSRGARRISESNASVTANNGRLTCFRRYTSGGVDRYATVMIANSGADFRNWGYLLGATAAQIVLGFGSPGDWEHDYAGDALRLLVHYAFAELNLYRVTARDPLL